jgi:protein involved in ribonucleotide reduction
MLTKDSVEQAYCFFHQKWRIYSYSSDRNQKEDIKYSVISYVEGMNANLYACISEGNTHFLTDYATFEADMPCAVERLERLMTMKNI